MSDINIYRERREVLDNILDRLRLLEAEVHGLAKAARINNVVFGLMLFLISYIAIKLQKAVTANGG